MITTILYIYLAGFAGTTGYFAYDMCLKELPKQYETKTECMVGPVVAGATWPVTVPFVTFMTHALH